MLYFGSFNPIHKGHIALAEYAIEKGLCDEVVLVVSPQNPLKPAGQQAPELDRFSMAETACAASKYPDKIKPSVIEFMLDKPSYTIHTLRHLTENYGTQMRFSILMGDDLVPQLPEWKQYREIIDNYLIPEYSLSIVYCFYCRCDALKILLQYISLCPDTQCFDYIFVI